MAKSVFFFILFLGLLFVTYKTLILNLGSHLPDWFDYPYIVWVMNQNIEKFQDLNFLNFFDTNAFHPHPYSLLFSDTLIPQSLISLPISFFSKNVILVFNLTFLVILVLNYLSSFVFWKSLFKNPWLGFLGTIFFFYSPYFHIQKSHFQMLFYWPIFLVFYLLFRNNKPRIFVPILVGILLTIQFLGSVYLAVFLLTMVILFYGVDSIFNKNNFSKNLKSIVIIFSFFLLTSGIFIKGYLEMKSYYGIDRPIQEFIQYSAHLSDYLFTTPVNSLLHNTKIINIWNSFDKNYIGGKASFPGFLLFTTTVLGLFVLNLRKKIELKILFSNVSLFFLVTSIAGFVFSLGPRLNFNGVYAYIPLPYNLLMKLVPFLESVRAPSRWSFLFYFGLVYFSLSFTQKYFLKLNNKFVFGLLFSLFFLEYVPISLQTHSETYLKQNHSILREICHEKKFTVLEVPITHFDGRGGIVNGLNNVTKNLLASTHHRCNLVNGYGGYDLPALLSFKDKFYVSLNKGEVDKFLDLLLENNVDVLNLDEEKLDAESFENFQKIKPMIENNKRVKTLGTNLFLISDY